METVQDAAHTLAELHHLVISMRVWQLAFQARPAAPAFVKMRETEAAVDHWLRQHPPEVPEPPDLKGTFP